MLFPKLGLSLQLLGTVMNKNKKVRCGNWEAKELSVFQIQYAARDAIASIAIGLKLIIETASTDLSSSSPSNIYEFYKSWTKNCAKKDAKVGHICSKSVEGSKMNGSTSDEQTDKRTSRKRKFDDCTSAESADKKIIVITID